VAILVESSEHGEALREWLNGWNLVKSTRPRDSGDNGPDGQSTPSALNRVMDTLNTANARDDSVRHDPNCEDREEEMVGRAASGGPRNRSEGESPSDLDRGVVSPVEASQTPADDVAGVIGSGRETRATAQGSDRAGIEDNDTRNRRMGGETPAGLNRVIVTQVAASLMQLEVDVIVWAGGGTAPQLPGFPASSGAQDQRKQLWVDMADDWDADAVEAATGRVRAYRRLGWRVETSSGLANETASADNWRDDKAADYQATQQASRKRRGSRRTPK